MSKKLSGLFLADIEVVITKNEGPGLLVEVVSRATGNRKVLNSDSLTLFKDETVTVVIPDVIAVIEPPPLGNQVHPTIKKLIKVGADLKELFN